MGDSLTVFMGQLRTNTGVVGCEGTSSRTGMGDPSSLDASTYRCAHSRNIWTIERFKLNFTCAEASSALLSLQNIAPSRPVQIHR